MCNIGIPKVKCIVCKKLKELIVYDAMEEKKLDQYICVVCFEDYYGYGSAFDGTVKIN